MWVRFKNSTLVNLSNVVAFENREFGAGIVCHCIGSGFILSFKNHDERDKVLDMIQDAISKNHTIFEIPYDASYE